MMECVNLSIGYSTAKPLFSQMNFQFDRGMFIALLGENGIGKSTLLNTLSGQIAPLEGVVKIDGENVHRLSAFERASRMSIVITQRPDIYYLRAFDVVALGKFTQTNWLGKLNEEDRNLVTATFESLKITHLRERYFHTLSDGEKQRIMIGRALVQDTPVIIMDEPTAFLDFKNRKLIFSMLERIVAETGKAVVVSSHDIEESLSHCNRFLVLKQHNVYYQWKGNTDSAAIRECLFNDC